MSLCSVELPCWWRAQPGIDMKLGLHGAGAWYMVHVHGTCAWCRCMVHVHGAGVWCRCLVQVCGAGTWCRCMVQVYVGTNMCMCERECHGDGQPGDRISLGGRGRGSGRENKYFSSGDVEYGWFSSSIQKPPHPHRSGGLPPPLNVGLATLPGLLPRAQQHFWA